MLVRLLAENIPPLSDEKDILRHSFFTFFVEGISRACSHQLVRHRVASYSQQSQRYVSMKNFPYIKPETFKNAKIKAKGLEMTFEGVMDLIGSFYESAVEMGIPKEDARFLLPNACSTRIVFTMNGEELVHFLRLRTCNRAQWEIRKLAIEVLKILRKRLSAFEKVGPNCYYLGYCPEGKKTCGKMEEVVEFFKKL